MSDEHGHDHDHAEHDHDHAEHDHDHGEHDHALIVDRLPTGTWRVDPQSSEVLFKARSLFGLLPVNGMFGRFSGEMRVDEAGAALGSLVVETNSVDTGLARRDKDLRSQRYFDVEQHPRMTFRLERVAPSGEDHLDVTGTLVLCATEIPLAFTMYAIAHGDHLHLEGRAMIDHDAAGLGWTRFGMVGKTARADLALTLTPAG